jgi:hypothetical protein
MTLVGEYDRIKPVCKAIAFITVAICVQVLPSAIPLILYTLWCLLPVGRDTAWVTDFFGIAMFVSGQALGCPNFRAVFRYFLWVCGLSLMAKPSKTWSILFLGGMFLCGGCLGSIGVWVLLSYALWSCIYFTVTMYRMAGSPPPPYSPLKDAAEATTDE